MTEPQRESLCELMRAILAVGHCPPDIRFRAKNLLTRVTVGGANSFGSHPLGDIFAGLRR